MKEETTITFFASECGEFHGMGECIECTSLKEAFRHYQRFCKRFPHMVPSLEFSLHHADDPLYNEGEYPLATGEKEKELLSYVPYYANHPLVQEAVKERRSNPDTVVVEVSKRAGLWQKLIACLHVLTA